MIPYTFLGGLILGLACALVGALAAFVFLYYRDRRLPHGGGGSGWSWHGYGPPTPPTYDAEEWERIVEGLRRDAVRSSGDPSNDVHAGASPARRLGG